MKNFLRKILKSLCRPFLRRLDWRFDEVKSKFEELYWRLDAKIYHTEKQIKDNTGWNINSRDPHSLLNKTYQTNLALLFNQHKRLVKPGEPVKIAFLFYIPSAWASFESLWQALLADPRFEPLMLAYERTQESIGEQSDQIVGAKSFLAARGIPYACADDYLAGPETPHIMFYQSPWEHAHLPHYLHSDAIKARGIRVAYVTYGIEYAQMKSADATFSNNLFKTKPWRMYAISLRMIADHKRMSPQGYDHIAAVGHPKFDAFQRKGDFALAPELQRRIKGRKIVLMTFHFPFEDYWPHLPMPDIGEYIAFLEALPAWPQLFFLLRPHPKFFFEYEQKGQGEAVKSFRAAAENCWLDESADYRNALFNAAYVVGDRSALMVEAAALDRAKADSLIDINFRGAAYAAWRLIRI
jgi:hypothetical protein